MSRHNSSDGHSASRCGSRAIWFVAASCLLLVVAVLAFFGTFRGVMRSVDDSNGSTSAFSNSVIRHHTDVPVPVLHASAAVLFDSLRYDRLTFIGTLGHWFHLAERLLPLLSDSDDAWPLSRSPTSNATSSALYLIFREAESPASLEPFSRFLLSTLVGRGKHSDIVVGYTTTYVSAINSASAAIGASATPSGMVLSFTPVFCASRKRQSASDMFVSSFGGTGGVCDSSASVNSPISLKADMVQRVAWDMKAKKRRR
jgi:hypothetical protein